MMVTLTSVAWLTLAMLKVDHVRSWRSEPPEWAPVDSLRCRNLRSGWTRGYRDKLEALAMDTCPS